MSTALPIKHNSINFETWLLNHSSDHDAKWCREAYPWQVFDRIKYDQSYLGSKQHIVVDSYSYYATITEFKIADNNRLNFLVHLQSSPNSKTQEWNMRKWDDLFHLVFDKSGRFITLFTEKKDPSKVILRNFLNTEGGPKAITERLSQIEESRSMGVSGMLFRSIVSYSALEIYPRLNQSMEFPTISNNNTGSALSSKTFTPFISKDRDLWICYSFTEEKAHRLAILLAKQSRKLIVVYCHPTFTRHHRCKDNSVFVISISEFLRMLSSSMHQKYIRQTRFLINHLRQTDDNLRKQITAQDILVQIKKQSDMIPIHTSDLRSAKSGLGNLILTTGDAAYVLACGNLINAALNNQSGAYKGNQKLSKEVYSFKFIIGKAIEEIIRLKLPNTSVYIQGKSLVYVYVLGIQFSFHAIPRTKILKAYQKSNANIPQEWSKIRLQPISPLVLSWAETVLLEETKKNK